MGLKAIFDKFRERVWPAPVAPFIQIIADAMVAHPGEFQIITTEGFTVIRVSPDAKKVDSVLVDNGVGVEMDPFRGALSLVTYYFDNVQLNWRERMCLMCAIDHVVEAYEDALRMQLPALDSSFDPA